MSKDFKLLQGDCLEVMKEIPDDSVDLVLTDPPYQITGCKWDSIIPFEPMWNELKRITKPNAAIVMTTSQPFTSALIMSNIKMFKYEWVWEKSTKTNFLNAKTQPLRKHENIVVFGNSKIIYNPQGISHKKGFTKQGKTETDNYGSQVRTGKYFQETTGYPHDILKIRSELLNGIFHPTQKPVALMEYLIKTYSNENNIVLDFTMGSGTTGVAALNTNRNFIGIELDENYFEITKNRIENSTKEKAFDIEDLF